MSGRILCHHIQDEVWQMICKLLLRMFYGGYLGNFEVDQQFYQFFLALTLSVRQILIYKQISYQNTYEQYKTNYVIIKH